MHHHIARQERGTLATEVLPDTYGTRGPALDWAYRLTTESASGSLYFVTDCSCNAGEQEAVR